MSESVEELKRQIGKLEARLRAQEEELQSLRKREVRYRQLMESNMVGVLFWNQEGQILDANDRVLEITGYTRDDLLAGRMNWLAMTPPEFVERERGALRELAETGVCTPFEKEYIRKDGSRVPILIGGALLAGSRDEGICFVVDISDRRVIESRLLASQRLFQAFTDNSPAVAFIKDAEGRRVYLNRRYREQFHDGTELLGKSDLEMYGPEMAETLRREDARVLATRSVLQSQTKIPTPDGVVRTWLTYKFPVENEQGELLVGGVAVDITELKQAQDELERINQELEQRVRQRTQALEQANRELTEQIAATTQAQNDLRRSEGRFRKWLEQSVVPTQVVSPDGRTLQVNRAWEELWGATLDDLHGFNMLTDPQMEERGLAPYIRRALAGEAVFIPETPYAPPRGRYAGQIRWSRAVVYPVKNDLTGSVEEIVLQHYDVTDRKEVEQRLEGEERVLRKLLDLHEQERKLIAYEIHDGLVQDLIGGKMLLDAVIDTEVQGATPSLHQASQLLRAAINEARRLINGLRPLVIDERGVVHAIEYLIAEEEQRGGPRIEFFHRVQFDRLPPLLEGTLFRIVQECINNARRHSGSPVIEIWLQQDANQLRLMVRDYGCGFDPETVADDRFGLEGIRKRAQIFGGTSAIESLQGEGTTVRVTLPLAPAPPAGLDGPT